MNTHINQIIEKYWEGETSLQEEQELKAYFSSGDVNAEHQSIAPLFGYFTAHNNISYDHDLTSVLQSRLEGEAATDNTAPPTSAAKVITMRRAVLAIAAIFAMVMTAVVVMDNGSNDLEDTPSYASNVIVLDGEDDSEEALEVTREALAFLSGKLNKSGKRVNSSVQNLDKMNVIY